MPPPEEPPSPEPAPAPGPLDDVPPDEVDDALDPDPTEAPPVGDE